MAKGGARLINTCKMVKTPVVPISSEKNLKKIIKKDLGLQKKVGNKESQAEPPVCSISIILYRD